MARTIRRAAASTTTDAPTEAKAIRTRPRKVEDTERKVERIATVPDKDKYLKPYINRKFGTLTDFQVFEAARKLGHNVLCEGHTGTGKTSSIMAYAAYLDWAFYAVSSNNGSDPRQLFGGWIPDEDKEGHFIWQDGPVTDIVRNGGILLLGEINFMPEATKAVLFGLLDKRRQIELVDHKSEVIPVHKDFMVFADMNPNYVGTREMNAAFRNRFATQLYFDYDTVVESKLVSVKSIHKVAEQFRRKIAEGLYDTPVSTNMLVEFEALALELNVAFAIDNFANHFREEDRDSVRQVFGTWVSNIESDLAKIAKGGAKKEDAPESDNENDWGIEGIDWVYEDEDVTV